MKEAAQMVDRLSSDQRSALMRRIHSHDTALECKVRSAAHKRGLRYRVKTALLGKPDMAFISAKVVVFIDSCFWHGCPSHPRTSKSNTTYWDTKISRNKKRDTEINNYYANAGWTAIRIWEHDIKADFDNCVNIIEQAVLRSRRGCPS
ncbi:very short patch repair endonuclease [Polyangium sorediatum]|uniref:very short patch repair endonuclease n=1 Tax=Polyangium sorediatum TaxID=889274 RepID=UPI0025496AFF|nr:very short patch repair endonuclease [Polyangium sorediatum]